MPWSQAMAMDQKRQRRQRVRRRVHGAGGDRGRGVGGLLSDYASLHRRLARPLAVDRGETRFRERKLSGMSPASFGNDVPDRSLFVELLERSSILSFPCGQTVCASAVYDDCRRRWTRKLSIFGEN